MTALKLVFAVALMVVAATALPSSRAVAAGDDLRIKAFVDCRCPDPVGLDLCAVLKKKISDSPGYRLVDKADGFGMGIHFSCVDLWKGINQGLEGRMSAASVTFTIYSAGLPGEIFEDSSVFRVGKQAVPEMSNRILAALGKLVSMNSAFFDQMRSTAQGSPSPDSSTPTPEPPP